MRLLQLDLELSVQCPMRVHKGRRTVRSNISVNPQYKNTKGKGIGLTHSVGSIRIKTYRVTQRLGMWVHQEIFESWLS